ncbi:MAG: hypothetical protein COW84_08310 [Gammaproteobacteria bacterium CG22_combo_CG10-13_8_21_14_all_40_8]|nr:MAG: hypothetical protein COW84_08310 [Gammaproteobacteria bacterium CG22_combo_CG10-13_8_21_14_all_40_8]
MKKFTPVFALTLSSLLSTTVLARSLDIGSIFESGQERAEANSAEKSKEAKGFTGEIEFGFVVTKGNSDNSNSAAKIALIDDRAVWRHQLRLEANKADADGVNTVERYLMNFQSDRKLQTGAYFFGAVSHEIDKFSGFDYQSTAVLGYGKNFYDEKKFKLSADSGPGYRYSKLDQGGNEQEAILHIGAKSQYIFTEATKLSANLSMDNGSQQTITFFDVGLVSKLTSSLSVRFNFNVKNTSNAPDDKKATDTITSFNVVYGF